MADSSEIFRRVAAAVDIVDVIAEHIALKRAGREFKGLCPFHDDRRPSMSVVPQKQIFHCFVCGTGGDVFKFVMNYHKMTAGEALRFLAQRAGIALPDFRGDPRKAGEKSAREIITETNEKACAFFERTLHSDAGRPGLDYFRQRGLTDETIAAFRLGMSPDKWTGLVDAAAKSAITDTQLDDAGLIKRRSDGTPYDVFRNRVMFPILDSTGRVIAFGGRVLQEKRDDAGQIVEAKYLNSPETKLFVKSETLYGLNAARGEIIKSGVAVIVEGYMDVIACHQAGVKNVVATLGTALTTEHARQLRRFCQTVVLVFDSDDAGHRAADRALELFVREPLDIKLASVADGKDPCDFCMANGGAAFSGVVAGATDAMTFQWRRLQKEFSANDSISARQAAGMQFIRFVAAALSADAAIDPIRRGLLMGKISDLLGLPLEEVSQLLKKNSRGLNAPENSSRSTSGDSNKPIAQFLSTVPSAERWVIGALLTMPGLYEKVKNSLSLDLFSPSLQTLAAQLLEYLENAADPADCSLADFLNGLSGLSLQQAIVLQQQVEAGNKCEQNLLDGVKFLNEDHSAAGTPRADTLEAPGNSAERLQKMLEFQQNRQKSGGNPRKKGVQPHY